MIDQEHLKYLITEEIYLMKESTTMPDQEKPPVEASPEVVTKSKEAEKKPEGNKTHEVVVWTHELTDKDKTLLSKMLGAVNLNIDSVHLIHQELEYTDHFKILLSFGHTNFFAEKTKKEILLNEPFPLDGKSILVSYPISSLHEDVKKKGALWNGLKKLFHT